MLPCSRSYIFEWCGRNPILGGFFAIMVISMHETIMLIGLVILAER